MLRYVVRLAWLVLRYSRSEELAQRHSDWTTLFAQVHAAPEGSEHLVVIIRYLLWVGGKVVHERQWAFLYRASSHASPTSRPAA